MNFSVQTILVMTAALLVAGTGGAGVEESLAKNAPARIELHDQYDAPKILSFPTTNITVLTIADRKGSEQVDRWIAELKPRYAGRIDLRGLADVRGVPWFLQEKIGKRFQETRQYPVMMDWSGKVCAQLGYQPGQANILILNQNGKVLGRFTGEAVERKRTAACHLIDQALSSPMPPPAVSTAKSSAGLDP